MSVSDAPLKAKSMHTSEVHVSITLSIYVVGRLLFGVDLPYALGNILFKHR